MDKNKAALAPLEQCTICRSTELGLLAIIKGIPYWRCHSCLGTIMEPGHWPDLTREKAIYDLHNNDSTDPAYQQFLSRLAKPLIGRLEPGSAGLDFGCGPGPALADMMTGAGLEMTVYDPIYFPGKAVLECQYDFITCTEVAEHLHDPLGTFVCLDRCLLPGGWLGLMTCFQTDDSKFANWHYRRDPTHVVFYREATLAILASRFGWQMEVPCKNVALFYKPRS